MLIDISLQNGQELLEYLSDLKPKLVKEYDNWVARYGEPDPSIPTFLSIAKEETALRRAVEQQRGARHTFETSRREEKRRADDRRSREDSPWSDQPDETGWRDPANSVEVGGGDRVRDVDEEQYNLQAEQLRREEDARLHDPDRTRRRVEEKRLHEQDGILRRQAEAEATARAVRRDIIHRMSPAPHPSMSRPDQDINVRPESPQVRSMPVAAPHPARPPNSTQFSDLRQAPSIMSLESPTRYDYDSSTDVEGKTEVPWHRGKQSQHDVTPIKRLTNGYVHDLLYLQTYPLISAVYTD